MKNSKIFCEFLQVIISLSAFIAPGRAETLSAVGFDLPACQKKPYPLDQIFLQNFFEKFSSTFILLVFCSVASSRHQESAIFLKNRKSFLRLFS